MTPKTDAIAIAKRIVAEAEQPPRRPTIDELEAILSRDDGPPVTINADGSIGVGPDEKLILAVALLEQEGRADKLPDRAQRGTPTPSSPSPRELALEEAAKDALAGWRYIRQNHGDLYGVGWDRVEQNLLRALFPPTDSGGG